MPPQGTECECQEYDQIAALVKEEVAYSDDSLPTPAEAVLFTGRPTVSVEGQKIVRDIAKPYWGNDRHIVADKFTGITGEVEIAGPGAAGSLPGAAALLRICGLAETVNVGVDVQFAPASENIPSASIYFHEDKDLWKPVGMRGNMKIQMKAGQLPKMMFDLWGLFNIPESGTLPTLPAFTDADPLILNYDNTPTATLFGQAVDVDSFDFDMGNVLAKRDKPGCYSVQIKDRKPTGTIVICAGDLSVQDVRGLAAANTEGAINVVHGKVAGEIFAVDLPINQLDLSGIQTVDLGDNEKGYSIPFDNLPGSGDDDFVLTWR